MYYECECEICKTKTLIWAEEDPYLFLGVTFGLACKTCGSTTSHHRVLTRKERAKLNSILAERALQNQIINKCNELGFTYRFVYQSVVITTPLADWCFDYHQSRKTLYHESTTKLNFKTGVFAKSHCQFRDKRMTNVEIIHYISDHDKWRARLQNQAYRPAAALA